MRRKFIFKPFFGVLSIHDNKLVDKDIIAEKWDFVNYYFQKIKRE